MILGIGQDTIDISRIERTLARFGEQFVRRVFTEGEQAKAARRAGAGPRVVAGTYAKRFAAKEACAKALGTGINQGVSWREMEVVNLPSGQPTLRLTGRALARAEALTPPELQWRIHLTLSDDYPTAQALVILEAM